VPPLVLLLPRPVPRPVSVRTELGRSDGMRVRPEGASGALAGARPQVSQ
jgi:hypothetical protein